LEKPAIECETLHKREVESVLASGHRLSIMGVITWPSMAGRSSRLGAALLIYVLSATTLDPDVRTTSLRFADEVLE